LTLQLFTIGLLGASDVQDRNHREWPQRMAGFLQIGKQSRIRTMAFGREGVGSTTWISEGRTAHLANMRCDVCLLSFFADAGSGIGVSLATSLANAYTIIDDIRAKRSTTRIELLKMWHMPDAQEATTFPDLSDYYDQYTTIAANRSNVGIIDTYTAWGDPASNPSEFDAGDQIHPLLPGHLRVTIPTVSTALASLIT
jgi:hypothetical protein